MTTTTDTSAMTLAQKSDRILAQTRGLSGATPNATRLIEELRWALETNRNEVSLLRSTVTDRNIEIEQLRKERDEARRECCTWQALESGKGKRDVAIARNWDCFPHTDGASSPENPDNSQQALDRLAKLDEEIGF